MNKLSPKDRTSLNPPAQKDRDLAKFFARVAIDLGGYDKMWQALVELNENILSESFLTAREKVRLIAADFIDDVMPRSSAEDYFSRKGDVRIPYSENEVFYPLIKEEMMQQFRKSAYCFFLTDGKDSNVEKMVVRYLATPFTFKPK